MEIGEPIRKIEVVPDEQPKRALPAPEKPKREEREEEKVPV